MHHHDSEVIVLLFVECSSHDERRQYYMSYACVMVVELECIGLSHALTSLHKIILLYAWLYTEILAIGGWISVAGLGTG